MERILEVFDVIYSFLDPEIRLKLKNKSKYLYNLYWTTKFNKTLYFKTYIDYKDFQNWRFRFNSKKLNKNKEHHSLYINHFYFRSSFKGQIGNLLKSVRKISVENNFVYGLDHINNRENIKEFSIEACQNCRNPKRDKQGLKHWKNFCYYKFWCMSLDILEIHSWSFYEFVYKNCSFCNVKVLKLYNLDGINSKIQNSNNKYYLNFLSFYEPPQKITICDPIKTFIEFKQIILAIDERVKELAIYYKEEFIINSRDILELIQRYKRLDNLELMSYNENKLHKYKLDY